ncbi:MAG: rod shape-determining protein MreC [bacterium]|nr:rod shape-determining protein MreC [bacterium]
MTSFFWRHARTNIVVVLLSVSILLMTTHTSLSTGYLKRGIMNVLLPFQLIAFQIKCGVKDFFLAINEIQSVRIENRKFREEIRRFSLERKEWQEAIGENRRLKKLLEYKDRLPYKSIAARVISYDPSNWANIIIIDKGKKDGIYKLAPVVTYQDGKEGLVGRVIEAENHSASVLLLNDQNSMIGAQILRSKEKGVIEGDNYRFGKLKYLPYDANVVKNDIVITSGDGEVFQKGLFIGYVVHVGLKDRGLFREVDILPFVKFSKLEEVLVLINKESSSTTEQGRR